MSAIEKTIRKVVGGGLTTSNKVARQLKNPWRKHPFPVSYTHLTLPTNREV